MRHVILGCAIVLGGCGEPAETPADVDAPPASSGALANGGSATGAGGVTLFALSDTLAAPVDVAIDPAVAPPEALPAEVTPRGGFFTLRASAETVPPIGTPIGSDLPQVGFDFFVTCRGLLPEECPQSLKDGVRSIMTFARTELLSLGYREPRLARKVMPDASGNLQAVGYLAYTPSSWRSSIPMTAAA